MKYAITKEFSFDSAHQLPGEEIYGKCANVHGHTYKMFIEIGADVLQDSMVMNFVQLKNIVNDCILEDLDHHLLNNVIWLSQPTTCELMSEDIFNRLTKRLNDGRVKLLEVKLFETPTSSCTYRG